MSPWRDRYFKSVSDWDKSHRLVGQKKFSDLFDESCSAILNSVSRETKVMMDVGAGSGVLGCAFLDLFPDTSVLFVEEDIKKASFLIFLFSSVIPELFDRVKVISSPYQSVSRETFDHFAKNKPFKICARAFSGRKTLLEAHLESNFANEAIYNFESVLDDKKNQIFKLIPLDKK